MKYFYSILLLFFSLMVSACHNGQKNAKGDQVPTVTTAVVKQENVTVNFHTVGTTQPYKTLGVKSLVAGELLKIGFREGDLVQTNQALFYIDPRPYQVQLDQAQANLARDQAQLQNAQLALGRNTQLQKKGYVSQQDFDAARTTFAGLTATVKADEAAIATAALQLSYCTITSPISGRAGFLQVDPGNLVKANDTNSLVTINQITPIYVVFTVPEQYLAAIRDQFNQGKVMITAHSKQAANKEWQGEISLIDNAVNADTGTIQMKATFNNLDESLWSGQFVIVEVPLQKINNALIVPTLAVQQGPQGAYVFVAEGEHAKLREVTPGPIIKNNIVIEKGLKVGEQVVVSGLMRLRDNSLIQLAPGQS